MNRTPFLPLVGLLLALPVASFANDGDPYGVTKPLPSVDAPPPEDDPSAMGDRGALGMADDSCNETGRVARVVAIAGAVHAEAPGQDPRSLSCNDTVNACETVITSAGARVGLMTRDVLAHVDPDTRLRLATQDGSPDLYLGAGAVRVIDTRAAGASSFRVATPHVSASGAQSDTEVFVGIEQARAQTRVCNHDQSIQLTGPGGQTTQTGAGACAVAAGGAVQAAAGSPPSIDVGAATPCSVELAGLGQLLGPDVAQGPPFGLAGFPGVNAANNFRRSSCDNPGSGCAASPTPTPTPTPTPRRPPRPNGNPSIIAVDPNPGTGCGFPGFPCGGTD